MSYNLGDAIGYIKLNIQDFEQKYNEVHSKTESLEKIVDGLGNVFDVAGKMAAAAFTGISAAAVKATQSVVNVGSSFQAAMSQVAATMGMSSQEIDEQIDSTKVSELLAGYRGEAACDVEEVKEAIKRVARLTLDFPEISELDINPIFVYEEGSSALDIKIKL